MRNSHSCETKVVKKDREKIVAVSFDHFRFSEECFYASRMEMLVPLPKGNKLLWISTQTGSNPIMGWLIFHGRLQFC